MGITMDAPNRTIEWRLHLAEPHGLLGLTLGSGASAIVVSLEVDQLSEVDGTRTVQVDASAPMTLRTITAGVTRTHSIRAGAQAIALE